MSQRVGPEADEATPLPQPSNSLPPAGSVSLTQQPSNSVDVIDPSSQPQSSDFDPPSRTSDASSSADLSSQDILQQAFDDRLAPSPIFEPIAIHDTSLDEAQRDAVTRALGCTDLFVIQGPTGTGKSRSAVEILRQAATRGDRILYLSPMPAGMDLFLPSLAEELPVVRRLGVGETREQLSDEIARLTESGRLDAIRERLHGSASENLASAEASVLKLDTLAGTWDEFTQVQARLSSKNAERDSLLARRTTLSEEIQRDVASSTDELDYYVKRLRDCHATHDRRLAEAVSAMAELQTAKSDAQNQKRLAEIALSSVRAQMDAIAKKRWYTLAYWKARSDETVATRLAEAEASQNSANSLLEELAVREQKLSAEHRQIEEEYAAEQTRMMDSELSRRSTELEERLAAIDAESLADRKREGQLSAGLQAAGYSVAEGRARLDSERAGANEALQNARARAEEVATRLEDLVREESEKVSVLAGPISGIENASELTKFGPFDLLVIDDAHHLSEADFHAAAGLARRWILLGQPTEAPTGRKQRATSPALFARLANTLRHDVWVREGARLTCRLYPVRAADRRRLECEPVADAPDIELRLHSPSDGDATLAEVSFPERFDPVAAREYLFRELGEVTCQPSFRTASWQATPEGIIARFGPVDPESKLADLGAGVREEVVGTETRAIHFSTEWTPELARDWTADNVGRRDPGRFVKLCKPQRTCPGLALWLNRAFATGFTVPPVKDDIPHVEFLAVPDTDPRRRREPQNRPGRVGGAGYEIDLSDPRQRAAVPLEYQDLPTSGYVNVPEAQALVRYLESHLCPGLAITSPFPTQVAVLRRLVGRSARLMKVPVLDAADAARHECDLLAVSLTRSHVARAVTFGETPLILAGMLSRARKKLLLAGDPGTLARRLQWEGPVDHLDAADSARERNWVAALADCPRVSHPRPRHYAEHSRT